MTHETPDDPLELLKNLWGTMGFSLPGMVAPTVDTDELGKRIADLKAVEGWLKTNLGMLQMSIQALEMQRATLAALRQMGEAGQSAGEAAPNPFLDPAAWAMPWAAMMGGATAGNAPKTPAGDETGAAGAKPAPAAKKSSTGRKGTAKKPAA